MISSFFLCGPLCNLCASVVRSSALRSDLHALARVLVQGGDVAGVQLFQEADGAHGGGAALAGGAAMTKKTPSMLEMVNNYVEHKRGLGYKLGTESYMLRSFARHADRQAPGQPLTTQLALEWATAPESDGRTYHAKRLDALRSFARYLAAFQPGTEIPPGGILGPSLSRVCYASAGNGIRLRLA